MLLVKVHVSTIQQHANVGASPIHFVVKLHLFFRQGQGVSPQKSLCALGDVGLSPSIRVQGHLMFRGDSSHSPMTRGGELRVLDIPDWRSRGNCHAILKVGRNGHKGPETLRKSLLFHTDTPAVFRFVESKSEGLVF
eukprot:Lithocolla_globosa_v1_NODE_8999_length_758_cov_4.113798.p2 type:complete len:137 gc:universal NODE_8999_length_758_cov_4.113798:456-46(-)